MPDTISLDQTELQPQTPISLDTGVQVNPLSPPVASLRAARAYYGLSDSLPRVESDYYKQFTSGKEPEVRKEAAVSLDYIRNNAMQKIIQDHAAKNGPLTSADVADVRRMVQNWNPANPDSVIEDAFSVKAVNNIYTAGGITNPSDDKPYSFLEDAMRVLPKFTADTVKEGSNYSSKIEWWRTMRENIQSDLDNQSWLGWGADQAKGLTQFYPEAKLRGNVPIDTYGGLGTSLEEQAKALLRMPKEEMIAKGIAIINGLRKDNPGMAAKFADAVLGHSDILLDNAFTALALPDLSMGVRGVTALGRAFILANDTRVAVKTAVQGLKNVDKLPPKVVVADSMGDLGEAAVQKELSTLTIPAHTEAQVVKDGMEQLQTVIRVDQQNITTSPGRFGQEIVNRLRENYETFRTSLFDTIERISKVERISPVLATEAGIRALKEEIANSYPGLSNAILNISQIYKRDLTNTYHAAIVVGNPNGGLFLRKETAEAFAKYYGLAINPAKDIQQQGVGFYLTVTKPVNETSHVVRDFLTATAASKSPTSWLSAFAGKLRTPEETLAHEQLLNRKVATYAPSEFMKVAADTARDINKLGKWTFPFTDRRARWNDFTRAVQYAQDAVNPNFVGPMQPGRTGAKGYFFQNPHELETFYQQNFQRLPNQQEIAAYFSFKRLGEMDYVFRNLAVYKNMSRVGAENHIFNVLDAAGNKVTSPVFQGVTKNAFPGGEGTTMIVTGKHGGERLFSDGVLQTQLKKEIMQGIKTGEWKVIELYDPELRPFSGFSASVKEERIRHVIVKSGASETKSLDFVNLPYKGGGHFEYDYEHYIKQANIRPERVGKSVRHWYEGDTTVMPIAIRAMGNDVVNKMNAVRVLLKNNDIQGAKELAGRTLPIEWKEFYGWFKDSYNPALKQRVAARLSLNEPFQVVQRGRMIIDSSKEVLENRYPKTFKDGTRQGSLARQYQIQYTGERDAYDLFTLKNEGTAVNPLYKIADPTMMDPIPTMNRALSRVTNSLFMDDYKVSAIEHWLREARDHLVATRSELEYAPFHYFNNITEASWKKGTPPEIVSQMETRRYQIKQFTGTASTTEALFHSLGQKLADSVYSKFGSEGLRIGGYQLEPDHLLSKTSDPIKFIRSLTFHAKLGLFAIPQFLVQNQTFINILGVAGFSKAAPGTFGALLHQFSRLNPAMIDTLDRYASRLHIPGTSIWRPGEFKEAWLELKNTGFANVAGEYALRDDLMSHKVISTARDQFLDAGTFFFKEGERNVRLGAWYTAYREWRDVHPTTAITDVERRSILDRAALLNVNMDRSSNSILQHGTLSIPAQFLTYQVRAAELMLGKRLTPLERTRLLLTNAAVYGVPTAISGATVFPFGDYFRKAAIDNGYSVGNSWTNSLMEGLPAALIGAATGVTPNVGERYGSTGFTPLRDAMLSDRTLWDIMTGAAGSTLGNTLAASDGFRTAIMGYLRSDTKQFKMKPDDVADIFKEISSFNSAWRLWAALNTGRWITKTEQWASDVTPLAAVMNTLTGLQDQTISDVRTMKMIQKDEKALSEYGMKKFVEEMHRSYASMENNPRQGQDYVSRAFTWLRITGVPEQEYGKAMARATQDYENQIQRGKWDFFTRDVPATKSYPGIPNWIMKRENVPQERLNTYTRDLQKGK